VPDSFFSFNHLAAVHAVSNTFPSAEVHSTACVALFFHLFTDQLLIKRILSL